jgi:hypothetical protein
MSVVTVDAVCEAHCSGKPLGKYGTFYGKCEIKRI